MATTSNMGLTLPDVSVTPGPTWASQINSDLTLIDQHNHTNGAGALIPVSALDINADVEFNGFEARLISRLGLLSPQTPPVPTGVYSDAVGDLYYDNAAGVPVQITNGNSIAGATGSISGMTPDSSASFDAGTGAFIWQKNSSLSQGATMDSGPLRVRDGSSSANAITLTPPSGMAANYTLTLPSGAPASQGLLTSNTSAQTTFAAVDSTLTLTSSLLKVANLGIGTAQLADGSVVANKLGLNSVTTQKIADGNVTQAKWGVKTVYYSGIVTLAQTNSTSPVAIPSLAGGGVLRALHPVRVEITPSLGSGYSNCTLTASTSLTPSLLFEVDVVPPSGPTSTYPVAFMRANSGAGLVTSPVNIFSFIYTPTQNGTFSFVPLWSVDSSINLGTLANVKLSIYEL